MKPERQALPPRTGLRTMGCDLLEEGHGLKLTEERLGVGCSALLGRICITVSTALDWYLDLFQSYFLIFSVQLSVKPSASVRR